MTPENTGNIVVLYSFLRVSQYYERNIVMKPRKSSHHATGVTVVYETNERVKFATALRPFNKFLKYIR